MKKIITIFLVGIIIMGQNVSVSAAIKDYRGQLSGEEKVIYDKLYRYFYTEQMNTSYTIKWNIMSNTENAEQLQKRYATMVQNAYSAIVDEKPEYYWAKTIQINYSAYDRLIGGKWNNALLDQFTVKIITNTPHQPKNIKKFQKTIKKVIKRIDRTVGKKAGKVKIIKAINRWICKNTTYDKKHGTSTKAKYEFLHNAYGVFVKKRAVCDGYAFAFKLLCDYYKIPCMVNKGYTYNEDGSLGEHAWNFVKIKKKWYIVDTTWNDTNKESKWLLCGTKTIKDTHINSTKRLDILSSGIFKLPKVSKQSYK